MHTYSMRGCSRERYVYYIALAAVTILAIANQVAGLLGVSISISTVMVFGILFFLFDRYIWKFPKLNEWLAVPDLSGHWDVSGETTGADGVPRSWSGTIMIEQTWSHIAVSIATESSRSRSTMAAIEKDPGHGYRLVYAYQNERKDIGNELNGHCGAGNVVISSDGQSGQGTYFNDHQRKTYGTMTWSKNNNSN